MDKQEPLFTVFWKQRLQAQTNQDKVAVMTHCVAQMKIIWLSGKNSSFPLSLIPNPQGWCKHD